MFSSYMTVKRDVSSANNLASELILSTKSLILTGKSRSPRTDPCGTPALIGDHCEHFPFKNAC